MSTVTATPAPPAAPPKKRKGPWLPIFFWVFLVITLLPIITMIVYSFNDTPTSRITFHWHGFTTYWYQNLTQVQGLPEAFVLSVVIALLSAIISIALGVPLAMALERYKFWGKSALSTTVFADIAAPSIVVGAASLSFFLSTNITLGFWTVLLVHVTFCLAYVVVVVRARLSGSGMVLEQAAADLGATPLVAFTKVTLPLLVPGMIAAGALALAMSIDDYVITSFVAGPAVTFPLFVYGAAKVGLPPQVLCFGTIIFVVGLLVMVLNSWITRRGQR
ncbi:ABC transporter permease [Microbacterium horticulturae]|uniref:ABC transporter permease n=1 Tax=Microbacterium horticulturae TaxID=3028316 RepID=A0ABY8BZL4_9MICO|nr:ABC transporter permease [Microbacterium sp. KACC 23027]WEG09651.1 ABC transporter permease [Microbacterium sp. KACC 23027]